VSSVNNMESMFYDAKLFDRNLCGAAWVHSEAIKSDMFEGSSGSIPQQQAVCTPEFSPQSKVELKSAVDEYRTKCAK